MKSNNRRSHKQLKAALCLACTLVCALSLGACATDTQPNPQPAEVPATDTATSPAADLQDLSAATTDSPATGLQEPADAPAADTAADASSDSPASTTPSIPQSDPNERIPMFMTGFASLKAGDPAPDFSVELIDENGRTGQTLSLSDLAGKPVVLMFWATWCRYCVNDMPALDQVAREHPGAVFIAINAGEEYLGDVMDFIGEKNYCFSFALSNQDTANAYPTDGIPYDVYIDGNGTVSAVSLGSHGGKTYEFATQALEAMQ